MQICVLVDTVDLPGTGTPCSSIGLEDVGDLYITIGSYVQFVVYKPILPFTLTTSHICSETEEGIGFLFIRGDMGSGKEAMLLLLNIHP